MEDNKEKENVSKAQTSNNTEFPNSTATSDNDAQQAATDAKAEVQRTNAWKSLEKLLNKLDDMVQKKINIGKEIQNQCTSVKNAFNWLKRVEKRGTKPKPSLFKVPAVTTTPATPQTPETTSAMDTGAETDSEAIPDGARLIRSAKRRQKKSPEALTKEPKKRRDGEPNLPLENTVEPSQKVTTDWKEVVAKRRKRREKIIQQQQSLPAAQTRGARQRRSDTRPNALIVRPKEKEKFADVLKRVKTGVPEQQVLHSVDKIRKTATGDLLIILSKKNTDGGQELQKTMADLLGDDARVVSKGPQEEIEIRDLDELTTKEEILTALQKAAGDQQQITLDAIKSMRNSYGGTQVASVILATPIVRKVLGEKERIKIGWVNCRMRIVYRPVRCFKCWHYGHVAAKCKSEVDRSKLCTKCGADGHKAAECRQKARCTLCTEKGDGKNCAHPSGGFKCPVYKEALQKVKRRQ